ncbi:MAG: NACHT domain-containing protein [Planctomycetota bacterium]
MLISIHPGNDAIVWLHLSDLHSYEKETGWDARRVLTTLRTDLQRMQECHGLTPDLIFFTGDAAWGHMGATKGDKISDQVSEAFEFLERVRTSFFRPPPRANIFLVPGNHDVNRDMVTPDQTAWLDATQDGAAITRMIQSADLQWNRNMERLAAYRACLQEHEYGHLVSDPERLIYSECRNLRGIEVGIVGFNSAWSSCREEEQAKLWLGAEWQIRHLQKKTELCHLLIGLIHHPFNWLVPTEQLIFRRMIQNSFSFLLHGHEHDIWVDQSDRHVCISADACYFRSREKNGYNLVRLKCQADQGEVFLRMFDPKGEGWVPCVVADRAPEGRWPLERIKWNRRPAFPLRPQYLEAIRTLPSAPHSQSGRTFTVMTELHASFASMERGDRGRPVDLERFDFGSDLVLLQGVGGAGKTSLLRSMMPKWITQGFIPVLVDLKELSRQRSAMTDASRATPDQLIRVLLDYSVVEISEAKFNDLSRNGTVMLILDGFNELSLVEEGVSIQERIIEALERLRQRLATLKMVVADRMHSRPYATSFARVLLRGVHEAELAAVLGEHNISYDDLTQGSKAVLSIPFFLDRWLKMRRDNVPASRTAMLAEVLHEAAFSEDDLQRLARQAYNVYQTESLFFSVRDLKELSSDEIQRLRLAGLIDVVESGRLRFTHQILHDYLAARLVLVTQKEQWDHRFFDTVSWTAQNSESIYLALEMLAGQRRNDFMEAIYDWHYPSAIYCLREDEFYSGTNLVSAEHRTAVLRSVAEKQVDVFPHTKARARELIRGLPEGLQTGFRVETSDPEEARGQLDARLQFPTNEAWYLRWREIVTRAPTSPAVEDLGDVAKDNAFIGWATANFLRRCDLQEKHWWWVSGALQSAALCGRPILEYRLVHVLGSARFPEAVGWLEEALDRQIGRASTEQYLWIGYGAVRSLMEIAASKEDLRDRIFAVLKTRAERLHPLYCFEVSRCLKLERPPIAWLRARVRLLQDFAQYRKGRRERVDWTAEVAEAEQDLGGVQQE